MKLNLLVSLYHYNHYANRLVLDSAARLPAEQLQAPGSPSHDTVFKLLRHMLACETAFLAYSQGVEPQFSEPVSLEEIRSQWDSLAQQTSAYLAGLDEEDLLLVRTVKWDEDELHYPVWQLLLQGMLHATHHRGELSIVMTGLGQPLPTLDSILFFTAESGQTWPWPKA